MKLRNFLTAIALFVSPIFAADIDIPKFGEGNKRIPLSISGFSGEVDKVVRFDLEVAGFELVPADKAQWNLTGANAGAVEGRLNDAIAKTPKFAKAYSGGTPRSQAHALADDVVQAVFGVAGVARTKIVFKRDMGKMGEIYVADYDGFSAQAVTSDKAIVASPTWGPGRRMLYYMSHRATYADIYSHDLTSGERKVFAKYPGSNMSPSVSRDGRKVAMVLSKNGSPDVYVANADGSNLIQVTKTSDDESSPTFSPDGARICFAQRESRTLQIVSANGGGQPRRLSTPGAPTPTEPDWSPDGKTIIFTSQAGGVNFNIYTVPADGSAAPTLITYGEDPSWAPNSRTVVFVRRDGGKRVLCLLDVPSKTVKVIPSALGSCSQPCWSR